MQLEQNQRVTGNDLARLVEGDQGTSIARSGNQLFVVTSKPGHSITSIRPLFSISDAAPENWEVVKLTQQDLSEYDREQSRYQQAQPRN